jgi:voltage-gated potassium channel
MLQLSAWTRAIDLRPLLPAVRVPTLVLRREDELAPRRSSQYLAAHIDGARLLELPGIDHLPWLGDAAAVVDAVEEHLTGTRSQPAPADDTVLSTVLFTDIVGSTEQLARRGDRQWRQVLDAHDDLTRREVERFRGRVVHTTGDGILASFDGPARAIRCAKAVTTGASGLGLRVRSGLHTGECEQRGDDLAGITVHIGSRVASLADAGEVLVTSTCATSSSGPASSSRTAASTTSGASPDPGGSSPSAARPSGSEPAAGAPVKSLGFILSYLGTAQARRSVRVLAWMLVALVVIVAVYSALFHEIMDREGQSHSWPTAVYWTLVTMSTLGFGDITFDSDLGRTFSVVVLLSGSAFILVLLPFTFIQFVFVPWMESSQRARAPRQLPDDLEGHVLLSGAGDIETALIPRLVRADRPYAVVVEDVDEALKLHDQGVSVVVGDLDDPLSLRDAGVDRAALVAATRSDPANANIAFTVREISEQVTVVATANAAASVDVLELAGCDHVLQLGEMLGSALARRVLIPDGRARVIGEFGDLQIAEASVPPSLVDHPLLDSGIRQRTGLTVAGVWARGVLEVARPTTVLARSSILVLAGSRAQLDTYDDLFGTDRGVDAPVVIIGGGRVGRSAGRALAAEGLDYRIVEQRPERQRDPVRYVVGDAADLAVLERAGIQETPSVVITTHDDDINVYLTIYCRRLRPDVQIIARSRLDRNVSTLHRAGADAVLSYASTGANAIWNALSPDSTLLLAEGMEVFRVPVPPPLAGKTLEGSRIREVSGCTVVALADGDRLQVNPRADARLAAGADVVLIGDWDAQDRFLRYHR